MQGEPLKDGPRGWSGVAQAWSARPLAAAALGLEGGLVLGRHWALAPAWGWAWTALALGGFAWAVSREEARDLGLWLALACLGLGLGRVQGLRAALDAAPVPDPGPLRLEARLLSDEGLRPVTRRHVFIAQPLRWEPLRGQTFAIPPGGLRLSADAEDAAAWRPGDTVALYGSFREPGPPSDPGQFDYRAYLKGRGLAGSVSAKQGWPTRVLARASAADWRLWLWQLQQRLKAGLAAGLEGRALTLAQGIVLGDKASFTRDDYADYARSGFADILAVSGAHFSLALAMAMLLAGLVTRSRRWQAAVGLVLGLSYAMVTGFEAPVQRAFALMAVWLTARLLDWECEALTSLAFGVLVILLVQPGAMWEAGFQLSVGCAWAVLCLGPVLARGLPGRWPKALRSTLGAAAAAHVALLPLLAFHFHQLCWPGLLACLVSGLFSAGILALGLPLALLGVHSAALAAILGLPLTWLLRALDASAVAMARWPGAAYSSGDAPLWLGAAVLLWTGLLLHYRGRWRRSLLSASIAGLALVLVWPGLVFNHRHPGETRVWMLDIGQGDSFLLEFGDGRHLLVDGGPAQPDAGAWTVVPALRALGIQGLDWALASHADADHIGGLPWVLDQMPVKVLLTNGMEVQTQTWRTLMDKAAEQGVPRRALGNYLAPAPDDGPWEVLWPSREALLPKARHSKRRRKSKAKPKLDTNGASVVLRVEDWLLLTGDLPKEAEAQLVLRGLKPIEVLKAGHHGSRNSSSAAFIQRLRPAHALLSCGADNRYGHPSAEALDHLQGVTLWRTDLQGCVFLRKRAGQPVECVPWRPADPAALRVPHPRYHSPWSGLSAVQDQAWDAQSEDEKEPENEGQNGEGL
jgi:competence protein ComEC